MILKKPQAPWRRARDRNKNLQINYGITTKEFDERLEAQGNKCPICNRHISGDVEYGSKEKANVDHDHRTKKIRGILCRNCNMGLGSFGDDIEVLIGAVVYLQTFKETTCNHTK